MAIKVKKKRKEHWDVRNFAIRNKVRRKKI